jgi:hypothetical protein
MKNSKFFLVLMVVLAPLFVNAQTQNVEFGLQVGTGFFLGNNNPVGDGTYTRTNEFAWMRDSEGMPAFETYGVLARYRFDYRWALQLQAMRQRTRFKEEWEGSDKPLYFYNGIWNFDVMAEFNILKYGFVENRNAKIYTVTPYVAVGLGVSFYNEHATYRWGLNDGVKLNAPYPMITPKDLAAAMYIPFAAGMKLRMASNWQFKLACQYNLYVLNGDLNGSTVGALTDVKNSSSAPVYSNGGGVELGKYKAASTHNIAVTVGVIYNLPAKGRGGVMIN